MPIFQDIQGPFTLRASSILSGDLVYNYGTFVIGGATSSQDFNLGLKNELILYIGLTIGNLTQARFVVEYSPDGVTWYSETNTSYSAGVDTVGDVYHLLTTSKNRRFVFNIKDNYIRVGVTGNGDATGSLMSVKAVIGIA